MEQHEVAICAKCGTVSMDVWMLHCPRDGEVMGETIMTRHEIEQTASLNRLA